MTGDEALEVLGAMAGDLESWSPEQDEAVTTLRAGLQHARVLADAHEDGLSRSSCAVALRRFRDWDEGRRT